MRPSVVRSFAATARAQAKKREVQVKLLRDVPGLGSAGELHNTSPGHMRNVLYPSGLALYQPRIRGLDGAASASSTIFSETEAAAAAGRSATSSSSAAARALGLSVADLLALQTQLESLPPLMFERPTTTTSSNPAAPQAHQQGQEEQIPSLSIHGSVGLTEILSELRNHHGVMDGTLAGSGKKASAACEYELKAIGSGPRLEKEKIKKTGEYAVVAHIHPLGKRVPLRVIVLPQTSQSAAATASP